MVRIPACHAGGREFESRPDRQQKLREAYASLFLCFKYFNYQLTQSEINLAKINVLTKRTFEHLLISVNKPMKLSVFILFFFIAINSLSQNTIENINTQSYTNYADTYNYTYWEQGLKSNISGHRHFTNQTNDYALNIDFTDLSINSLLVMDNGATSETAFSQLNSDLFTNQYSGDINYAILQNGIAAYNKASTPTSIGNKDSQMAEFGTWQNKRFVSTNFTNAPQLDSYFTGVEFTNWHNRFKITFHVKPTATITNGQLQLSIDIPTEYINYYNSGSLHAYGLANNKGFVVKGGEHIGSINKTGNTLTVTTNPEDLLINESYEVSLIFHVEKNNLSTNYTTAYEEESEITITGNQTQPFSSNLSTNVTYNTNEGVHYIEIPRYGMGQYNCNQVDQIQTIDFSLQNSASSDKRVRLSIRQTPSVNVTGFNSMICNANGDPSGLPIQVSKNWHSGTSQFHSGSWIREYTEFIIPANTTLNFMYKRTGAKWGETYTASSHQLSVVGAGIPKGGWLEASLGSFGESITHSPDYLYGNTNAADIRPFLVTNGNYGGTSSECNWTGNVGGMDICVYNDAANTRHYQSEVKTKFHRYSPNLSETTIGAISEDKKIKLDYTFYLNRSDDYTRIYYKVNIEALQNTSFNRFDIIQLGGDIYNIHNTQSLIYGNDSGMVGQFSPTNNGSNAYTTAEIGLVGENPWIWAGDGLNYGGANSGIDIDANNGMIIRDYKGTFNGVINNTPYFRERSSSLGFSASHGTKPTSYCLVPPPGTTSFITGDKIELLVELVILPKADGDYYGPNTNFSNALATYGNSHDLLHRESLGNKIIAESQTNTVDLDYPLTVETLNNSATVEITGGRGYIPIVFSNVTNVTNPQLWRAYNNCWELVDQSQHGKDFWQADYKPQTGTFDLIFNVNQDITNDSLAKIKYYLGNSSSNPVMINQTKVGSNSWSLETEITVESGVDSVWFAPQINENNSVVPTINNNYTWSGPNDLTYTGRELEFLPVSSNDEGQYSVTYDDGYGCSTTESYSITMEDSTLSGCTDSIACNYDITAANDNGTCEYVSCSCYGDFDQDGLITIVDLTILLADYGCSSSCISDLNNDEAVTTEDINLFLGVFGINCN